LHQWDKLAQAHHRSIFHAGGEAAIWTDPRATRLAKMPHRLASRDVGHSASVRVCTALHLILKQFSHSRRASILVCQIVTQLVPQARVPAARL